MSNPEFRRNLWLQLSAQRLVVMPLALGIVIALVLTVSEESERSLALVASVGFFLMALVWGSRRAAESIAEEVAAGTWDGQRMSTLGAWSMTWGKLLGSTAYPWYGALICLVAYAAARATFSDALDVAADVGLLVEVVLLGQAVSLAANLALWRKQAGRRATRWAWGQGVGIFAGVAAANQAGVLFGPDSGEVVWYGQAIAARPFWLAALALLSGWALAGAYRLMRQELQYRTTPWVWSCFVLFCMIFAGGFAYHLGAPGRPGFGSWQWHYVAVGLALVYAALFAEPKSIIRYRQFADAAGRGDGRRLLQTMPLWLPAYALTCAAAAVAVALADAGDVRQPLWLGGASVLLVRLGLITPMMFLAGLLFALRDIAIVLALSFGPRPGRSDVAAFIYLAFAYGPLAWLAGVPGEPLLTAFLVPVPGADPLVVFAPVAIEILAAALFLLYRWRRYGVPRPVRHMAVPAASPGVA